MFKATALFSGLSLILDSCTPQSADEHLGFIRPVSSYHGQFISLKRSVYSPAGVLWPTQHAAAAVQPRCVSAAPADSSLHRRALGLRCIHVPRVRSSHGRRDREGVRLRYKGSSRRCQCCIQSVSSVEESHSQGEMWGLFLMCITIIHNSSALDLILNWNVLSIFTKYHIFTTVSKTFWGGTPDIGW